MSINQILIVLNGEDQRVLSKNSHKIILAEKELQNINQDHTLLQSTFESLEDLIKAEAIIKNQFSKICTGGPKNQFLVPQKSICTNLYWGAQKINLWCLKNQFAQICTVEPQKSICGASKINLHKSVLWGLKNQFAVPQKSF